MLGSGADEDQARFFDNLRETRVFREKPIARMDGFGARDLAGGEDRRLVQIALRGRRRPDADALIRQPHMHCTGVRGRVNGDRLDPHLTGGADDTERDLAPVCDQDFLEHARVSDAHSMIKRGSPNSTGSALSTSTVRTLPERGAGMRFMVFMASMIRITSPSSTMSPGLTKLG